MIEERFTDAERRLLLDLALAAVPQQRGDPALTAIIAKLCGVDTVLVARRAYAAAKYARPVPARPPGGQEDEGASS